MFESVRSRTLSYLCTFIYDASPLFPTLISQSQGGLQQAYAHLLEEPWCPEASTASSNSSGSEEFSAGACYSDDEVAERNEDARRRYNARLAETTSVPLLYSEYGRRLGEGRAL